MRYIAITVVALLLWGARASAQEEVGTVVEPTPSSSAPEPEQKRSAYYKKVRGWLWLEGVAGPSSYDPDQFGSLFGNTPDAPKRKGPQYGFALGTGFGGGFFLGWYYRQANYTGYKIFKTGVEFQPTIRIPYVHIGFRAAFGLARIFDGNPWELAELANGGLDATFGVGLRIPIVRWVSIAATFDWSYIGLSVRGNDASGTRQQQWVGGQQLAGTFALTFHFIGVRKD
jgi:hypothetical protein